MESSTNDSVEQIVNLIQQVTVLEDQVTKLTERINILEYELWLSQTSAIIHSANIGYYS